jgi:hypothetical protein
VVMMIKNDENDQQIFIISHGETISRSCLAPFVVEARIEPSTLRLVSNALPTKLSWNPQWRYFR